MKFDKVCVVGLGYIGLPTAAIISASGVNVVGLDVDERVISTINSGKIHIVEPGLEDVIERVVNRGTLRATLTVEPADVFVIAVPTPFEGANHTPDLKYVRMVADNISKVLTAGNLVILESTSPVGTTEKLRGWLSNNRPDLNFVSTETSETDVFIAYCPERVLPGNVIQELYENDRVIGGLCGKSSELAIKFYRIFVSGECYKTDANTAEMAKLVENSYRDVNIAFANELAAISSDLGINVWELIRLANRHPRVNILSPGAGVGGHCIAVDPWFIVNQNPEKAKLVKQARLINDTKPQTIIGDVQDYCQRYERHDKKIRIGLFGLSYKPDIDDMRNSPAVIIAKSLAEIFSGQVFIVEPNIQKSHSVLTQEMQLVSQEEALFVCDLVVFLVPHRQFKESPMLIPSGTDVFDYCGLLEDQA